MPTPSDLLGYLPHLGLAACAVAIFLLADQNADLTERYEALRERAQWPHAGYAVPTFRARTLAGDTLTVGHRPAGHKQLLLVFDTECPYCRASLPAWRRIARELEGSGVQIVGISLDPDEATQAYREEHGLSFPIVRFPEPKLEELYRARSYPLLVLLDADGRTLYSRLGVLERKVAVDSVLAATLSTGTGEPETRRASTARALVLYSSPEWGHLAP